MKNVQEEGPGSIEDFLLKHSILYRIFEAKEERLPSDLEGYTSLIVLGGPMGVYEMGTYPHLRSTLHLIERAIRENISTLGICLGSQLIAHALGARVYKGHGDEIGWKEIEFTPDALLDTRIKALVTHPKTRQTAKKVMVFQWHGDTFDLPQGSIHLAKSEMYPHQAFKYGERIYALQFHIEVIPEQLNKWFSTHPLGSEIREEGESTWEDYGERACQFLKGFFQP